ncbi:CapA family protein [Nannocystaceae bacterium ST9]
MQFDSPPRRSFALATIIGLASLLAPAIGRAYLFDAQAQAWETNYMATPIDLEGRVIDEQGLAIVGAQLSVLGWGESADNEGEAGNTWVGGAFSLPDLARANVLLKIEAPGYYPEIVAVELQRPLAEASVDLGDVVLYARTFNRARLSFGGDVMFGRRMLDADEDGVLGEAGDLLHMNTLTADTAALFRFVEPVLLSDDLTSINLETPVTANLATPHPVKSFVFNAYPESAAALEQVGVDMVTIGNNHVFDYLTTGTLDTIANLDALGMPWVGAGTSDVDARGNSWATSVGDLDLALNGFGDLQGTDYGSSDLYLVATDPSKPGALWSTTTRINQFIDAANAAGRFAIPQFHGGTEYSLTQTAGMRGDFQAAIERGAGLVIAHHPHVVHGVSTYDAGEGPRFVLGSLGNFVFDQDFYATYSSYLVSVDLEQGVGGVEVARLRLLPIQLDGYVPRLLTGVGVSELGRQIAQLGTAEQLAGGLTRAVVFAEGGKLVVVASEAEVLTSNLLDQRTVALSGGTTGPVALAPYSETDALAKLATSAAATCEVGRDLILHGDFEDRDVDDQAAEGDRWDWSSARYVQRKTVHAGEAAAVLLRVSSNTSKASLGTIARVPVVAGRKYSITGWSKGDNAGKFEVFVRWVNSGGVTVSSTTYSPKAGGTWDWQAFTINPTAPAGAVTVELSYRESPPASGEGVLFLDDLELIEWDPSTLATNVSGTAITTPNGWDAVRCAAAGASLGLTLTHKVYETPAI